MTQANPQKQKTPGRIKFDVRDAIAHITISNPDRYNAMSLTMWRQLNDYVLQADQDPGIRLLVLRGEGEKAFVSGADISEFETLRNSTEQVEAYGAAVKQAQHALSACGKPVMAAIRGVCMGGGIGLALACDLRFCTQGSRFRMPAAKMGLGYDLAGIRRTVNVLGAARTAEIFYTARDFYGPDAERMGMVQRSFEDGAFEEEIQAIATQIANNAPLTIRAAKLAIRNVLGDPEVQDEARIGQAIQDCFDSNDYKEGQQAFKEKRPPVFTGT